MELLLAVAGRLLLGALFLVGGLAKLRRPQEFTAALRAYQLLPPFLVRPAARWIPVLEVGVGGSLVIGWPTRVTATLAIILLLGMAGAMTVNLLRGRRVDCGCLGLAEGTVSWLLVFRNLVLSLVGAFIAAGPTTGLDESGSSSPNLSFVDTVFMGLAACLGWVFVLVLVQASRVIRSGIRLSRASP